MARRTRHLVTAALTAAALGLGLAACTSEAAPEPTPTNTAADQAEKDAAAHLG